MTSEMSFVTISDKFIPLKTSLGSLIEILERKVAILRDIHSHLLERYIAYQTKAESELYKEQLELIRKRGEKLAEFPQIFHDMNPDAEKLFSEKPEEFVLRINKTYEEIDRELGLEKNEIERKLYEKFKEQGVYEENSEYGLAEAFKDYLDPEFEPPEDPLSLINHLYYLEDYYGNLKRFIKRGLIFPIKTLLHMENVSALIQHKARLSIIEFDTVGKKEDTEIERIFKKNEAEAQRFATKKTLVQFMAQDMKKEKPYTMAKKILRKFEKIEDQLPDDIEDPRLKEAKKYMLNNKLKPMTQNTIVKYLRETGLSL